MISPADALLASVLARAFGLALEEVVSAIEAHRRQVALAPADLPEEDVHWEQVKAQLAASTLKKG